MYLVLTMACMTFIVLGCQSKDSKAIDAVKTNIEQQSEDKETLSSDGEITYVSISKFHGDDTMVFDDEGSIEIVKSLISNAVKQPGIVNMADPVFKMIIVHEDESKESFHLWIGEKGQQSVLMNLEDTHIIYTISEAVTSKFVKLIE